MTSICLRAHRQAPGRCTVWSDKYVTTHNRSASPPRHHKRETRHPVRHRPPKRSHPLKSQKFFHIVHRDHSGLGDRRPGVPRSPASMRQLQLIRQRKRRFGAREPPRPPPLASSSFPLARYRPDPDNATREPPLRRPSVTATRHPTLATRPSTLDTRHFVIETILCDGFFDLKS